MRTLLPLVLLAACGGDDIHTPNTSRRGVPMSWVADAPIHLGNALAVVLPHAASVAILTPGEAPAFHELGGSVRWFNRAASAPTLLVSTSDDPCAWWGCVLYEDDDVEVIDYPTQWEIFADNAWKPPIEVEPWLSAPSLSDDGRWAVADVADNAEFPTGTLVDLSSIVVADLTDSTTHRVHIGFNPLSYHFAPATDGTERLLVLSANEVAVVNLSAKATEADVRYPLSLPGAGELTPSDVTFSPDGRYAMVPVAQNSDLYVLDLLSPSVNILSLTTRAQSLFVDGDYTYAFSGSNGVIHRIDNASFGVDQLTSAGGVGALQRIGDALWAFPSDTNRYMSRFSLEDGSRQDILMPYTGASFALRDDGTFASATTATDGGRLMLMDLVLNEGELEEDARPFALNAAPTGNTWQGGTVWIAQQFTRFLLGVDPATNTTQTIDLVNVPRRMGTLDDGTLWITHDDVLGAVTFRTPSGELDVQLDFARDYLLDPRTPYGDEPPVSPLWGSQGDDQ